MRMDHPENKLSNLIIIQQPEPIRGIAPNIALIWSQKMRELFLMCGKREMPYDFMVYKGATTNLNHECVKTVGFDSTIKLHPNSTHFKKRNGS